MDSDRRLGRTLLQSARPLGKRAPRKIPIDDKISPQERSQMSATTRPPTSLFMQRLQKLRSIEANRDGFFGGAAKELPDELAENPWSG